MTLRAHWRMLGFDARENAEDCRKAPISSRIREKFLIREEIECPYSVDKHIWPSHFEYFPSAARSNGLRYLEPLNVDAECKGGLWLNLTNMRRRLSESHRRGVLIAIELLASEAVSVNEFPSPLIYSETEPPTIPEGSALLGYDVADSGFWSGLSNCGYTEEQLDSLRPVWRRRINDLGLIETQEAALEFSEISDKRVPRHAPFWVFRLHQLSDL